MFLFSFYFFLSLQNTLVCNCIAKEINSSYLACKSHSKQNSTSSGQERPTSQLFSYEHVFFFFCISLSFIIFFFCLFFQTHWLCHTRHSGECINGLSDGHSSYMLLKKVSLNGKRVWRLGWKLLLSGHSYEACPRTYTASLLPHWAMPTCSTFISTEHDCYRQQT